MTYTVSCLTSLQQQCLVELIAQSVDIRSLDVADGYTAILIECDAATAGVIAERWLVAEV